MFSRYCLEQSDLPVVVSGVELDEVSHTRLLDPIVVGVGFSTWFREKKKPVKYKIMIFFTFFVVSVTTRLGFYSIT